MLIAPGDDFGSGLPIDEAAQVEGSAATERRAEAEHALSARRIPRPRQIIRIEHAIRNNSEHLDLLGKFLSLLSRFNTSILGIEFYASRTLCNLGRARYQDGASSSSSAAPLPFELLTPLEMAEADRLTIAGGPIDGIGLMRRAGNAVASAILERFPDAAGVAVLAGPGNNGGDGYVIAEALRRAGVAVTLVARRGAESGQRCGDRRRGMRASSRASLPRSRPQTAGWWSTRCSEPGSSGRLSGVYAQAIEAAWRGGRRTRSSPSTCRAACRA